jgi:hypothetical protein
MVRLTEKMRDMKLGMLGERVVADRLEDLKVQGFAVFHDVPCLGATGKFNLDHVVIGQGAVAVIETKTKRKRSGRHNSKGYEVTYNGKQITWPGWKGHSEILQTIRSKDWLAKRLKEKLNIQPQIHAFIAIPGWKVNSAKTLPVVVQSEKFLVGAILNVCKGDLKPECEAQIVRHLRDLCQDVGWQDL